ncbi:MAG: hypothetical protein U0163_08485 [Gemmatimonadaceae bacterium]
MPDPSRGLKGRLGRKARLAVPVRPACRGLLAWRASRAPRPTGAQGPKGPPGPAISITGRSVITDIEYVTGHSSVPPNVLLTYPSIVRTEE